MRNRVEAGDRGHSRRLGESEVGVQERHAEHRRLDRRRPSSRASPRPRRARTTAPRFRCRRSWERPPSEEAASALCRSPDSRVMVPPLVRRKLIRFGRVHRAAAPETDERVDSELRGEGAPSLHHQSVRVLAEIAEDSDFDSRSAQNADRSLRVRGRHQSRIGGEERATETFSAREVAQLLDRASSEDEARSRLELEAIHSWRVRRAGCGSR